MFIEYIISMTKKFLFASLLLSITQQQMTLSMTQQAIRNAKSNIRSSNVAGVAVDSLFLKFPSTQELDLIILNGNKFALLRTIQMVATDSTLKCDEKISYLLEIFGRIRIAVEIKRLSRGKAKIVRENGVSQLTRLQDQMARLQDEARDYNVGQMHRELREATLELQNQYRQYNEMNYRLGPIQSTIKNYKDQIQVLKLVVDGQRRRMADEKLMQSQAAANVQEIRTQLAAVRQDYTYLNQEIAISDQIVDQNNVRIERSRSSIRSLEDEIESINDAADRVKLSYSDLEVDIKLAKQRIRRSANNRDDLAVEIRGLEAQRALQSQKLMQPEINSLQSMIDSLTQMASSTQSEIDIHYSRCFREGVLRTQTLEGVVFYIFKGSNFKEYLQKNYNTAFSEGDINRELRFTNVDVFGRYWTIQFGYPNFDSAPSQGFNCLQLSNTVSGAGQITSIGPDFIEVVTGNRQNIRLSLSSCSRLQASQYLPIVGQHIAFLGVQGNQGLNMYKGTCW